eukprot:3643320-Karenia_brevis.AAC.1
MSATPNHLGEFVNYRHLRPRHVWRGGSRLQLRTPFLVHPLHPVHWAENSALLDLCDPCRTFALGPVPSELSSPPWELL